MKISTKKIVLKARKTNRVGQGRIQNKRIRLGKIRNRENNKKKANPSKTSKTKKMKAWMNHQRHLHRHHRRKLWQMWTLKLLQRSMTKFKMNWLPSRYKKKLKRKMILKIWRFKTKFQFHRKMKKMNLKKTMISKNKSKNLTKK
jgi:hypothetical protein